MHIKVTTTSGFCWGVRRAMDMALEASARFGHLEAIHTVGSLIHNQQALAHLSSRGVEQLPSGQDGTGGSLILRAHGIPFPEYQRLASLKAGGQVRLFNGTCPEVAKVQACIRRYSSKGFFTIILGDEKHPEVVAHRSYASQGCTVIADLEEAKELPDNALRQAIVVTQTTFKRDDFRIITDHLKARQPDLLVRNTICRDTWERQAEAEALVRAVDFVVVVGGKASNNTRHLVEVARRGGKAVQHVETAEELDFTAIQHCQEVGVLAGASTPHWVVDEVVDALERVGQTPSVWRIIQRTARILQLPLALGMAMLTLLLRSALGWGSAPIAAALVLTFWAGACAWAPYLDPLGLDTKGVTRGKFLRQHRVPLLVAASGLLATALTLAGLLGLRPFLGLVAMVALGLGHLRSLNVKSSIWNLRRLPATKDLGQALAAGALVAGIPWLQGHHGSGMATLVSFSAVTGLALAVHVQRHIREFQDDRILGRELLPIAIGVEPARWVARGGMALGIAALGWGLTL